MLKPGKKDSDD